MIKKIHWPEPQATDSDDEEDDAIRLEKISVVTGFLRTFIEEGNSNLHPTFVKDGSFVEEFVKCRKRFELVDWLFKKEEERNIYIYK